MKKTCGAVIVAAGSARRMEGIDKAMTPICGVPMLLRTVRALAKSEKIDEIAVVTRTDLVEEVKKLCAGEGKLKTIVVGGQSRAESVLNGLYALDTDLVAIHDGARPLITAQVIDSAIDAAEKYGAAAPAIPVHDTIKVARKGIVTDTPDRSTLFAVQTPQVFCREKILSALKAGVEKGLPLTDDCSAAEFAGMEVRLTAGSEENLKITVPTDLLLAEAILKGREDA